MNGGHRRRAIRPNKFTGVLIYRRVRSATARVFVTADYDIQQFPNFEVSMN